MAWLAVNLNGDEFIHSCKPERKKTEWECECSEIYIPKGTISKIIGKEMTWDDEPYELLEEE